MSTATLPPPAAPQPTPPAFDTVADVLHSLGDIPPERVLWNPYPGTATEDDAVRLVYGDAKRLVELIDGTLVEKAMSHYAARVGGIVFLTIENFLETNDLGYCYPADALLRILPRQVRLPDVSFISWAKLPDRELPAESIAGLIPDLAVEVLSPGNTRREMERKRRDYFAGGVRLVWQIDPDAKTAEVYTAPDTFAAVPADGTLDGADVLPGFTLSLAKLFERAGKQRGS
ncbi:MAG: Uma2 family endonuclease [Gemmataceae bacterium]